MNGFFTYEDAIQSCADFLGGAGGDAFLRDAKRAIRQSYLDIANAHNWSYLYRMGRYITSVPVSEGTIRYTHTGGAYERMFTLTEGPNSIPWPSWASLGTIRIGTANHKIAERKSDTIVTADELENPGADIVAGTGFVCYQDTYLLPDDFVSQDTAMYEQNFGGMTYVHPREWAYSNRYLFNQGIPQAYTIIGDPRLPGRLTTRIYPFPTANKTIDFIYKRRPRPMNLLKVIGGTATTTAASNSIIGTGTLFTPAMVGSVIRVSPTSAAPTSHDGSTPPAFEAAIASYISATNVLTYDPSPATLSGVGYTVSDPADIEVGSMLGAYQRGVDKTLALMRNLKEKGFAIQAYDQALREAKYADSRSFTGRFEGQSWKLRIRLRDMPLGPDQP